MTDLRLLSAAAVAQRIRDRQITSREAVEVHIDQILRVNPTIRAVVRDRFDAARAEADAADAAVQSAAPADLPPLHGVPCTIKECFAFKGMPNSSGLLARKHVIAGDDATAVVRLRRAGAIPLGVTNVSELCMWMESYNYVYGRTNNPYDPTRIAGGSSGGEGAIVGAGGSPFGLGSDIGGSIRGPAFFNGVFGHKPTGGMVPGTGQYPMAENEARRFLTTGPLCRRAEDLMPLLRILAGPDGKDTGCEPIPLGDPASVTLEGRTLLDVEDNGVHPVSRSLREAQRRAVQALEARGMKPRTVRFEALKKQFELWSAMMSEAQDTSFGTMLGQGKPIRPLWELVKLIAGRSDHTPMALLLALTEPFPKLFPGASRRFVDMCRRLRDEVAEMLGDGGVLLYPSHTTPAPKHDVPARQAVRLHMPWAYLGIMNVLFLPATQVPLGLSERGLPLGVQVVSRRGNDHVTIAVAMALERAFGGWTPPKLAGIG